MDCIALNGDGSHWPGWWRGHLNSVYTWAVELCDSPKGQPDEGKRLSSALGQGCGGQDLGGWGGTGLETEI